MQILFDFLPIIVFFAVYQIYGAIVSTDDAMFAATIAIMVVMTAWDPLESTCRHASLSIL